MSGTKRAVLDVRVAAMQEALRQQAEAHQRAERERLERLEREAAERRRLELENHPTVIRAREALAFLAACELAGVPLSADVVAAKEQAARLVSNPSPQLAKRTEPVLADLRPAYLEDRLRDAGRQAAAALLPLSEPGWRAMLEAWRPGFGLAVDRACSDLGSDNWSGAADVLRELDRFFDAWTQRRVDLLAAAARGAGYRAEPPRYDTARRVWTTDVADGDGQLFEVTEQVPDWRVGAAAVDAMQLCGPRDFDGPQCIQAGLREIADQLAAQGVGVRIYEEASDRVLIATTPLDAGAYESGADAARVRAARDADGLAR
jgi:hypothetical protein